MPSCTWRGPRFTRWMNGRENSPIRAPGLSGSSIFAEIPAARTAWRSGELTDPADLADLADQGPDLPADCDHLPPELAVTEDENGRDADDLVPAGEFRMLVGVDSEHPEAAVVVGGERGGDGGGWLARGAP